MTLVYAGWLGVTLYAAIWGWALALVDWPTGILAPFAVSTVAALGGLAIGVLQKHGSRAQAAYLAAFALILTLVGDALIFAAIYALACKGCES